MIQQLYISLFKRKIAVKIYLAHADRRVFKYWAIPEGNIVKIGGKAFILPKDDYMLEDNIPTYFCNYENASPVSLITGKVVPQNADEFGVAIRSRVAQNLFDAMRRALLTPEGVVIISVVALAIVGLGYYLDGKIAEVLEILKNAGLQ